MGTSRSPKSGTAAAVSMRHLCSCSVVQLFKCGSTNWLYGNQPLAYLDIDTHTYIYIEKHFLIYSLFFVLKTYIAYTYIIKCVLYQLGSEFCIPPPSTEHAENALNIAEHLTPDTPAIGPWHLLVVAKEMPIVLDLQGFNG